MKPLYLTVGAKELMVIPDSEASMDGHPVLTYTYSIYKSSRDSFYEKESNLHLEKKDDPDYMGFITFEQPGKLFTYTADGADELDNDQVEELIEIISHYRGSPSQWII